MNRRTLISGTAAGALASALAAGAEAAPGPAQGGPATEAELAALRSIADAVRGIGSASSGPSLAAIRTPMLMFLRASGKFPDFIEVGSSIWFEVYDWHVRYLQPFVLARTPDNRYYTIQVMGTTSVVLRHDVMADSVLTPYDNR